MKTAGKLITVAVAALVGAAVGAALGYGPLLKYRSEGVLAMEMSLADYKRFTEVADAPANLQRLTAVLPPPKLTPNEMAQLDAQVAQGQWHTAIPKISKADASSVPDALVQPDGDKQNVFLGVKLAYVDRDPVRAAQLATWLGGYWREMAAHAALREAVQRWAGANRQFADRVQQRRLQYQFDVEQAQARAKALEAIAARYPAPSRGARSLRGPSGDGQEVGVTRSGDERFMPPLDQVFGAESEVIDLQGQLRQLEREAEQQAFAKPLIAEAQAALDKTAGGADGMVKVSEIVARFGKAASTDADKEILASMAGDVSQISARFLSQSRFVAEPSVPSVPQRPSPRTVILLGALLAALLGAAFVWRDLLVRALWEGDRDDTKKEGTA
ncbi:MAG: hypothetical protein OJF60_000848 [Burkholderiaceae bacterium]|jgi:hypothetical protein|nr:MAG: hypothetical protein OJF60_000848 [Burkholderiaceae bacterium]